MKKSKKKPKATTVEPVSHLKKARFRIEGVGPLMPGTKFCSRYGCKTLVHVS